MADLNPKLMGDPNKEFDPYKMLAEKYGRSSSSSAAPPPIPFNVSLSPAEVLQSPASSSSAMPGPNTVDRVKSSSMEPVVKTQKKPDTPKKADKKKPKQTVVAKPSAPKADAAVPFGSEEPLPAYTLPAYTPPTVETQPREDFTVDWQQPQSEQVQKPITDPHRTVLQALMGWDDVPFGKRWTHFTQHGFTGMHGDDFDELMRLVESEKGNGVGSGSTYGQALTAREHRRSILDQWNKLLSEWNSGRYASGDAYTVNEFFTEANRLRQEFANAGFNPNELRHPAINAGGFQQGFQKDLQADRAKLDWLGGWLNEIQHNVARDPHWLDGGPGSPAQMYFDKLSEYVILNWAQSKGAIADADKVRAQVAAMTRADRLVYDKFMQMFFNANTVAQVNALANAGNRDAMAFLEDMKNFISLAEEGKEGSFGSFDMKGDIQLSDKVDRWMNSAMLILGRLQGLDDNPIDLSVAVTSYKNAKDAFQQYVMQNANVDRKMIWDSAIDQYNIYKDMYNRKIPQLGLYWGWEHRGPVLDENFGDYLAQWQSRQPVNAVIRNAKLAIGSIPKPINDPLGNRGGKGGNIK